MLKLKLLLILIFTGALLNLLWCQSSGFLGHKFNLQANLSPNLGVRISYLEDIDDNISDYLLVGGDDGYKRLNLLASFDVSASYVISRKGTLGVEFDKSVFFGTFSNRMNDGSGTYSTEDYLIPFSTKTYMLKYDSYSAIAPVKRYVRFGLGLMKISYDERIPSDFDPIESYLRNLEETFPSLLIGFGGNEFISDRIYINYGMDFLYNSALRDKNEVFYILDSTFNPYRMVWSNFMEINLGIGFNI